MKQPHQYRPLEQQPQHDACGIGAVVNISGQKTHRAVDDALKIVEKLEHRTGKDADGTTGDGVGIMTQLPHALFQKAAQQAGQTLPDAGDYGAAMIFFPQDPLKRMRSRKLLEMILSREGLELLFWRDVPVCPEILSEKARSSMPYIAQCFIRRPDTAAREAAQGAGAGGSLLRHHQAARRRVHARSGQGAVGARCARQDGAQRGRARAA